MRIIVGLGGNQGDVPNTFRHAVRTLAHRYHVLGTSHFYRSAPIGPPQDDFLNAAILIDVTEHPREALSFLHTLEEEAGRERTREERWGPRPLDLDLLISDLAVIESSTLTLPHPRLAERLFALLPAAELASAWLHPRLGRSLGDLAADSRLAEQSCVRAGPFPA